MKTTYETTVIGFGNHAAIEIPDENLAEIGGNRRAPLRVTINGYTYRSTATGVDGKCMVVFPTRDREASGTQAGDMINVTLEHDGGYREVDVPASLAQALTANGVKETFYNLNYSTRKAYVRQIIDAKSDETIQRRINRIVSVLKDV